MKTSYTMNACHVQPHVADMSFHQSFVSHKMMIPSEFQRQYDYSKSEQETCHEKSIDSEELHLLHCRRRWGQRNNTWQGVPGWASRRWRIARHKSRPLSRASSISPQTCFERRRETTQRGLRRPLRSFGTRVWGGQLRMPFESAARQPSINHKQSNLTHLSACESNPYNRSWKLSVPSKTFTNSTFNPSFLRCSSHARIELHHPN